MACIFCPCTKISGFEKFDFSESSLYTNVMLEGEGGKGQMWGICNFVL